LSAKTAGRGGKADWLVRVRKEKNKAPAGRKSRWWGPQRGHSYGEKKKNRAQRHPHRPAVREKRTRERKDKLPNEDQGTPGGNPNSQREHACQGKEKTGKKKTFKKCPAHPAPEQFSEKRTCPLKIKMADSRNLKEEKQPIKRTCRGVGGNLNQPGSPCPMGKKGARKVLKKNN